MPEKILVVDDEINIRESISYILKKNNYDVEICQDGEEALELISKENFTLVISDISMPKLDGISLLTKITEISPKTFVIIITAYASIETAVKALRLGAFDYIIKPLNLNELVYRVNRLIEHKNLALENKYLREEVSKKYDFDKIIGKSPKLEDLFKSIKKISKTDATVLIQGKSGTGKELVAKSIHYHSKRSNKKIITVNCGAIAETIIESELFGHRKGSFTGSVSDKDGLFKVADEGTIFLDEISEMPLNLQVKLLRVLEQGEVTPVGATEPIHVNVRIIAATNKILSEEVEKGKFREDLFFRLNVIELNIPSIEERRDDIPLLVDFFIHKFNQEMGTAIKGVENDVMRILMNRDWKGQIREIENVIERAMIFTESDYLKIADFPQAFSPQNEISVDISSDYPYDLKSATRNFEKKHILKVLQIFNEHREKTAEALGINVSSLYRKLSEM
ncbi:sigma-54-dependent Fis family transcriptional regulator [bacterium]|nr:sigma-54-dependent Fis family transcriptional regulator [bacterium]